VGEEEREVDRAAAKWPAGTSPGVAEFVVPPPRRVPFLLGVVSGALLVAFLGWGVRRMTSSAVTLRNGTGFAVHRVVLEGQGVWEHPGSIGAGEEITVRVWPRGEGHYTIRFLRESGNEETHEFGYHSGASGDAEFEVLPLSR
jgi:hypothetical protein